MVMLVTSVTDSVMVVFVFVVCVPMLVTGVTSGVMVVFVFVVDDMVMLLTGVTSGAMPTCRIL
jgi:ABC-type spermidine/putrescine transport system permease subunit II